MPSVGTRLSHSGYLGTVRFVGEIEGTAGTWLGVEWDDPQRGKHDGVKDGKRYFSCSVPGAGSFIRQSPAITYGQSFLTSLISKYIELPRGSTAVEKVILGSSNGAIEVEAVGLDRIRGNLAQLERLREISLDGENVATADPPGTITNTCPGTRGLDLSKNLIRSWDVVAMITDQLPQLHRLALNQNRLQPPTGAFRGASAFRHLRELQLNATLTEWHAMQRIIVDMPVLRSVEMGYNRLEHLFSDNSCLGSVKNSTLEDLNFDTNRISNWLTVCDALRTYPALRRLVLTANSLERIEPPSDGWVSSLQHLQHLSLSFNRLSSWRDINAIPCWCPELESLSLTGNPLVEDPEQIRNARQFAIASIPSLTTLDAAAISLHERADSELFYLSYVNRHGPTNEDARQREHPQWAALCEKISVCLCAQIPTATGDIADASPSTRLRVLPTMSVRAFRMKLIKSCKIPRAQQASLRMWLKMPNDNLVEIDGDDGHELDWWGLEGDSHLFVYTEA
ncbi:uncharacterized protein FIBRA_06901 [Fibroporia radiculosa]|uniref:CAP-Gly domain-containing protein n=1 Tax=Fibroporia radiculosa TaxID=599839 RepID=J4H4B7_9APHY|nr:uncharacterized protein FIBRA_06901 [Fibroporia radiculosa]CCM04714.1 predicted protein [Fibroporia radiculosa]